MKVSRIYLLECDVEKFTQHEHDEMKMKKDVI